MVDTFWGKGDGEKKREGVALGEPPLKKYPGYGSEALGSYSDCQ